MKDKQINIRVTNDELELLKEKAKKRKMTVSEYMLTSSLKVTFLDKIRHKK